MVRRTAAKLQPRLDDSILRDRLECYRQTAFLTGRRQAGKSTTCRSLAHGYLDWDNEDHRELILRDWSGVEDPGRRAETLCACHLLKAVAAWSDLGLGSFELRYLVIRDGEPWFLVEARYREDKPSPGSRNNWATRTPSW